MVAVAEKSSRKNQPGSSGEEDEKVAAERRRPNCDFVSDYSRSTPSNEATTFDFFTEVWKISAQVSVLEKK